jgi:voltage-gated potassium channel
MKNQPSKGAETFSNAVALFGPYDFYMLVISTFSIIVLATDSLLNVPVGVHEVLAYTDTALCGLFFMDFLRSFGRAPNRLRYFATGGWLDLASSIPTINLFRLGRLVRIARIVRLLRAARSVRTIGQVITRHRKESALAAAALVTVLLIVFASLAILQFEQTSEANIRTGGDALWWAFATITTVGYGDRFPVTPEGRLVAATLMAAGVALFGTLSGLVASWFLHGEEKEEIDQIELLTKEVARLGTLLEGHVAEAKRASS